MTRGPFQMVSSHHDRRTRQMPPGELNPNAAANRTHQDHVAWAVADLNVP